MFWIIMTIFGDVMWALVVGLLDVIMTLWADIKSTSNPTR